MAGSTWWRRAGVVVLLSALLTACGDDDDGERAEPTGSGWLGDRTTETTEASESTTTSTSTTTEAPTTTTTLGTKLGGSYLPDGPPFRDDRASGSGCTPGPGSLPDGWWYGTLDGAVTDELTVDLACYYVGAAAEAEAASRGDEVVNDYYIVNENPALRTMPVAEDATASCVEMGSSVTDVECAPDEVDGSMWAVWLRVADGQVDRIVEQFAP